MGEEWTDELLGELTPDEDKMLKQAYAALMQQATIAPGHYERAKELNVCLLTIAKTRLALRHNLEIDERVVCILEGYFYNKLAAMKEAERVLPVRQAQDSSEKGSESQEMLAERGKWACVQCGRGRSLEVRAFHGEYPEDGEVFCSTGCRDTYKKLDPETEVEANEGER